MPRLPEFDVAAGGVLFVGVTSTSRSGMAGAGALGAAVGGVSLVGSTSTSPNGMAGAGALSACRT
jgi:hypothetical protein